MNNFYETHRAAINRFIDQALEEDIEGADHTSNACFEDYLKGEAILKVKDNCVIAGITLAEKIFYRFDPSLKLKILAKEGEKLEGGSVAFEVEGCAKSLLASERLVLNCMQRMSGIATLSQQLSQKIKHTKCKILDTRKTTPGFRYPEKWAVAIGGGYNHRMGLFDAIMIKDNHIDFCGGVSQVLEKTKAYLKQNTLELAVIIEVRNEYEIDQVMNFPWVNRILLDNMNPNKLSKNVEIINGEFETEASGNINAKNLVTYAETGVDYVSMGSLTYSAVPIDLSLKAV